MFLIEEHRGTEIRLRERVARRELVIALDLDAEVLNETLRRVAVRKRRGDALRAAVPNKCTTVVLELVSLGVAAEIIVVVQNQNAFSRSKRLAPEIRRRESGDPCADNDEVVGLAGVVVEWDDAELPIAAALDRREGRDRVRIVAAKSGQRGRIAPRLREGRRGE